jgi:6-phosphofructokinase 2
MANIASLTISPAIDLSTIVERMTPGRKLRCKGLKRDPGGGGINVARVVCRLGSEVIAVYTCGGIVGRLLEELVAREVIESRTVQVTAETREDFTVHEEESGQQFRFVLAGPKMAVEGRPPGKKRWPRAARIDGESRLVRLSKTRLA